MNKRAIKIVKHDAAAPPPAEPSAEDVANLGKKEAADSERNMVDSVKGWITERAENSRAEGKRSVTDRVAWKTDDVSKPS